MSRDNGRGSISDLKPGMPVLVAGGGVTGRAVLAALTPLGVTATVCDDDPATRQRFADAGTVTLDSSTAAQHIADYALVVTSPGFPPTAPVPAAAEAAGVPVWGDVELAWRLDASGHYGPPRRWLAVTGTNGKTTTTSMLQAMLTAAGLRSTLCGNIGSPVLEVLDQPADFLAVELSSFQLHWAPSVRPEAGVVLNIAEDHLDWHSTLAEYIADKARVLTGRVAVAGLDDPRAAALLSTTHAPIRVGFRLGDPAAEELGVRDGMLVDRAFSDAVPDGTVLAAVSSIPVPGPVGVLDALAAAALARSVGVPAAAVANALATFRVGRHRAEVVAVVDQISYVDDSKATNPHAAEASVLAYPRVVWIAGGLLKGASVQETVARIAPRLVGAVLIGRDRAEIAEALSRHAPDVPVVQVVTGEDADMHATAESPVAHVTKVIPSSDEALGIRVMNAAVAAARDLAHPGDTVLLAPAGASFDQFTGYADRGDAFASAVRAVSSRSR
jgi:UDP-N-acetylmuramoylalanine--D-glutamate ligase